MSKLTDKERELLEIIGDPVKWIEYETGIKPRWYQAEILRDPSKRIVMRCARRLGKSYTIAMHMLWHAFTTKNAVCLYVAPSDSQISTQFQDITKVIAMSKALEASVVRQTKSPYVIEFGNGALIKGVTAGTKSGSKGFALRGQKATWLYVDEMDYLAEDDWNSIYPIVLEAPDRIGVTVSSTPTGKRGIYYNMCFVPGTKVTMADGTQEAIESVHAGDYVLTHTGTAHKVKNRFVRDYVGEVLNIRLDRFDYDLKCTPEHPFYVCNDGKFSWIEAKDLKPGDTLAMPLPQYEEDNEFSVEMMEFFGYYCGSGSVIMEKPDKKFPIDEQYLRYGLKFTLKKPEVANRLKELVDRLYGIKSVAIDAQTGTVSVFDVKLANDIYNMMSTGYFIDGLCLAPIDKVKAFMSGYLSSNSYINTEFFCTVKQQDLSQFMTMLMRLGVYPRINIRDKNRLSAEVRINKVQLRDNLGDLIKYEWPMWGIRNLNVDKVVDRNYLYVTVKAVTGNMYAGPVYNLHVDEDESYCANMIAVHNCTNKKLGWREFHHPIMVHPEWNPSMEAELRSIFTSDIAWEHEELAEFGTEVAGVFSKTHIDRARQEYEYTEFPFYPALRTIGVDWDKYGAETQILVLEYRPETGRFKVLNRRAIPKSEFTLDNGVETIKDFNARYNPQWIYVDRGFGEHQVESLHKYGLDHPETELARKVKGIAFGSSVEVRDPFTKKMIKKPIKPFMVDQLSIQLERDRLVLNDNDVDLWRDMENYNIVRWTSTGAPVFTSQNEHTIDALLLAMTAFILEIPEVSGTISPIEVTRKMARAEVSHPDPLQDLYKEPDERKELMFPEEAGRLVKVPVGTKPKKEHSNRTGRWGRGGSSERISRRSW